MPLVEPSARHAGRRFELGSEASAMPRVVGNAERLGQMVINLLVNAIEAAAHRPRSLRRPRRRCASSSRGQSPDRVLLDGLRHWLRPGRRRTTHIVRAVCDGQAGRRGTGTVGRPRDRRTARRPDHLAPRRTRPISPSNLRGAGSRFEPASARFPGRKTTPVPF